MEEEVEAAAHIPIVLNAEAFITARFKEINTLSELLGRTNRVASIFQRLPKHMRRRAMSHTIKRVPRNLRDAHKRQLEKNRALKKPKKVRKCFRKRAKNLLLEYNRRQKTNLWLETHIWHAKRFRMISKWGYKIAESSFDKTFRASYRGIRSHCLMQDISYYCCIELNGSLENLISGFKLLTSPECGVGIGAKCWLNGSREGNITLFHANCYPYNVIGNVTFHWKPSNKTERVLWLWCHPAFYQEVLDEFIKIFDLQLINSEENEIKDSDSMDNSKNTKKGRSHEDGVEKIKMVLKNISNCQIPRYFNKERNISVSTLKHSLNRFRLTGPLSNAVLTKALHPANLFEKTLLNCTNPNWWKTYHKKYENSNIFQLLEKYSVPSQFPLHAILGAHVLDPRLFLKRKKTKAIPENETNIYCLYLPTNASESAIWDADIREEVCTTKISNAKLNDLRKNLLVPGFDHQLLKNVNTVIPVLLIQRPGLSSTNAKLAFGSGWDVIIPANWAMPVWLSFILCGAKAGGLRETRTLNFESLKMPELFLDSRAGMEYYEKIKKENEIQYFRRPPNKRSNYIKNGFPTPFYCPWDVITKDWTVSSASVPHFVFRNVSELRRIREYIENIKKKKSLPSPQFSFMTGCLIPVIVSMLDVGQLASFSHICLPTESDLRSRLQNKMYGGPAEQIHKDTKQLERKALRLLHTKELKRLRRLRKKEKKIRLENCFPSKLTKRKQSPTEAVVESYLKANMELWIPSVVTTVRDHCDREICGFVVNGGYSFSQSCNVGQGFITSESFSVLMNLQERLKCDLMVLTRSPSTLCYRFCSLNVIV